MAAWGTPIAIAVAIAAPTVKALQMTRTDAPTSDFLTLTTLDAAEVERRGSHCLDGTVPGYYHKQGTDTNKWIFWFQGGSMCSDEDNCANSVGQDVTTFEATQTSQPLQNYGEFATYNHVYIPSCDRTMWLGDVAEPVSYDGKLVYYQGKRILDHFVDSLTYNAGFGSATDVLFAGGSGGGQASYVLSDYIATLMPKSVTKFGVAPINGWYPKESVETIKDLFTKANMSSAISPACEAAMSGEPYKCLDGATSYKYSTQKLFATQIFDDTFEFVEGKEDVTAAYDKCLSEESKGQSCDDASVKVLQNHLDDFTATVKAMPKYTEHGQGGFFSTCTVHTFYSSDDLFNQYAIEGVTAGAAIETWWKSLDANPEPTWHLPCTIESAQQPQCEKSCIIEDL